MGTCPSSCEVRCGSDLRYNGSVFELNLEPIQKERKHSSSSQRDGHESATMTATKKGDYCSDHQQDTSSVVQDEQFTSNLDNPLPLLVSRKSINETEVKVRENRFIQDLEIEVRARIRAMYEYQYCSQLEEQQQMIQYIQKMNSLKLPDPFRSVSPEQDESKSQPKTFTKITPPEVRSEGNYNPKLDQKRAKAALEKLATEFYVEDESMPKKKLKKKGILKTWGSMRHLSRGSQRSKSNHSRKVHFSADTNFQNERKSENFKPNWWRLF